jgi:hypothetical protein
VAWRPSAWAGSDAPIGFVDAKENPKPDRIATAVTIPTASGVRVNRIELICIDTASFAMNADRRYTA